MQTCPYCRVVMQDGFFVDNNQGMYVQSAWVAGQPAEQRLLGFRTGTISLSGRTQYPVMVYRCPQCGFLQSFALPPDKARDEAAQTLLRAARPDGEASRNAEGEPLLRASDKAHINNTEQTAE